MNEDRRKDYTQYRLESAHKTLEAAKVLAENNLWNSAVNRLYYAAFYAANALLIANKISTKTHSATISQFSLHFVKTGIIDKKYGSLLAELFDKRMKGDYGDVYEFDEKTVRSYFDPVRKMIERIESEIVTSP